MFGHHLYIYAIYFVVMWHAKIYFNVVAKKIFFVHLTLFSVRMAT